MEYETLPNVRIELSLKKKLNEYCEKTGADIASTVRLALTEFLENRLKR